MKTKIIFPIFIIMLACIGQMHAQIVPSIKKVALLEQDQAVLKQHVSKYTTFTIDKRALIDSLYKKGRCQFQIQLDEQLNWNFDLQPNDMRAPNYKQTYISDKGTFEYKDYTLNTFKGKTSKNQIVRFTIDENNFVGVILDNDAHYVIRPTKDYTRNLADESFIAYKSSDVILQNETSDYIHDALAAPVDSKNVNMSVNATENPRCPYYLKIATDADFNYYNVKGNSLAKVYSDNFSALNIAEGVYESTFNMKFVVVYQHVWTTNLPSSGYPYNTPMPYPYSNTETDGEALLESFRNYWNNNMTGISRNIAHLFSGQSDVRSSSILNKRGKIYGIAYKGGGISTSYGYGLSVYRADMYLTTAHEIGHNCNATDDPKSCDCVSPNPSLMCQGGQNPNMWFCPQSINEISPYLASRSTYLTAVFPSILSLAGTVGGFNVYQAIQKITSTQIINSEYTVYKTKDVELGYNFEVKLGAAFEIVIDNSGCL